MSVIKVVETRSMLDRDVLGEACASRKLLCGGHEGTRYGACRSLRIFRAASTFVGAVPYSPRSTLYPVALNWMIID